MDVVGRKRRRKTHQWTECQLQRLSAFGPTGSWDSVASHVGGGVSAQQCKYKYEQVAKGHKRRKAHHWTQPQLEKLKALAPTGSWAKVASQVGAGVSAQQCKYKYEQLAKPGEQVEIAMSSEEIQLLKAAVDSCGKRWTRIGRELGWNPTQCRKRFERLVKLGVAEDAPPTKACWTPEEGKSLLECIDEMNEIDFEKVVQHLQGRKTKVQCYNRFQHLYRAGALPERVRLKADACFAKKNKKWSACQVEALKNALLDLDPSELTEPRLKNGFWSSVASKVPSDDEKKKSGMQCQQKFYYETSAGRFRNVVSKHPVLVACKRLTCDEIERLKSAVKANGRRWTLITKQVGWTATRCRERYQKLVEKAEDHGE